MDESRHLKKESLLAALEKALGVVTVACRSTDTPRSTYYKWLNEDLDFAASVVDIENVALDFAESQLHKQISENSTAATIFYLKTKGKKRTIILIVLFYRCSLDIFTTFVVQAKPYETRRIY